MSFLVLEFTLSANGICGFLSFVNGEDILFLTRLNYVFLFSSVGHILHMT